MATSIVQKLNLEGMSVDELWRLHEDVSRILSVRLTTEKQELEKRLAQLQRDDMRTAASSGLRTVDAVPRTRRKYPKVLPKYRNPKNTSETWSGRGKQPRWLVAALKAGSTINEFVIDAPRTGKRKSGDRRRRNHNTHA